MAFFCTSSGTIPTKTALIVSLIVCLIVGHVESFTLYSRNPTRDNFQSSRIVLWQNSRRNNNEYARLQAVREEQTRASLIEAMMNLPADTQLVQVHLTGKAELPTSRSQNKTRACAVLSTQEPPSTTDTEYSTSPAPCLFLPLANANCMKLIQFAAANKPLTKTVLLRLNLMAVNRDLSLFDNVPWASWTVDPAKRNRDAANNPILARFHLGKRDAFNVFLGKDWQGNINNSTNLAAMADLARQLEASLQTTNDDSNEGDDSDNNEQQHTLAKRILELQIRELEMDLAECDYQLAVGRKSDSTDTDASASLEAAKDSCAARLETSRERLREMTEAPESTDSVAVSWISSLLDEIGKRIGDSKEQPAAPYRGATGYRPAVSTPPNDPDDESATTFSSPYAFWKEIIRDQLKADVIGTVLEDTSLLEGTLALGGAVILRRKTATKSVSIAGERLQINDETEDYGNKGIQGGETYLVECDADEAIGMSVACDVPLRLESGVWERASLMAQPAKAAPTRDASRPDEALIQWTPLDPELSVLVEGQAGNQSTTERVSPLRIPLTTTSLFDSLLEPSSTDETRSSTMFPTDNPVQSLAQYDDMSNDDKARTLMSASNFEGRLPRPRVLRANDQLGATNPLDDLLLPLIDESVRRQYLIRDAELRGDTDLVRQLKNEKSRRQITKEKAELAREAGAEDVAERWEKEAELSTDLRADVTQDEGSYSRFLDRDDWYERDRQKQAKKIDKKKFGNLLDGIE